MWLVLFGVGALAVVAIAEMKRTSKVNVLPDVLSVSSSGSGGETAAQQEEMSGAQTGIAIGTSLATGNVAGAAAAAVSGLLTQLTQHSARLSAAKAENVAMQPAVAAFDADLQAIAAAYSSGQITAAQAAGALQTLDQNIYANLHGLVGKPGTAWGNPPFSMTQRATASQTECNTACTFSCCVYSDDLHTPLSVAYEILLGLATANSLPPVGQATPGGFIINVPEVYPPSNPAYGNFTRPAYSVSFVQSTQSLPLTTLGALI
jgi:hypothetical protein